MNKFIFIEQSLKFCLPNKTKSLEDFFNEKNKEENFYGNYIHVKLNGKSFYMSKNSKVITFIDINEKKIPIFITETKQILIVIKFLKFQKYIILKNFEKKEDMTDKLDFDSIKQVNNYLFENDYNLANKEINEDEKVYLTSLSLSYQQYQKHIINQKDEVFYLNDKKKEFNFILKNQLSEKKIILICGPKSIGKSTSLLYFMKLNFKGDYFYYNLSFFDKFLKNNRIKEYFILNFCKELYNILPFEEVEKYYNILNKIDIKNSFETLINLIKNLVNEEYSKKNYYIIIDQYKYKKDKGYKYLKELYQLSCCIKNIHIIIYCSINGFDFSNSLTNNLNILKLNFLFVNNLFEVSKDHLDTLNEDEKILLKECGNLYKYYNIIMEQRYKNTDMTRADIIKNIKDKIKKYFENKINENEILPKLKKTIY